MTQRRRNRATRGAVAVGVVVAATSALGVGAAGAADDPLRAAPIVLDEATIEAYLDAPFRTVAPQGGPFPLGTPSDWEFVVRPGTFVVLAEELVPEFFPDGVPADIVAHGGLGGFG